MISLYLISNKYLFIDNGKLFVLENNDKVSL